MKMKRRGFLKTLLGAVTTPACMDLRKADPPSIHGHMTSLTMQKACEKPIELLGAEDLCDKDILFINTNGRVGIGHCPTEALHIEASGLAKGLGFTPSQKLTIKS